MRREPPTVWESFRLYVHLMGWPFRVGVLILVAMLGVAVIKSVYPEWEWTPARYLLLAVIGAVVGAIIRAIGNVSDDYPN